MGRMSKASRCSGITGSIVRSCFLERGFDGPFGQRVLRIDARRDDDGRDGHTDDVDRGVALAESFQWAMRGRCPVAASRAGSERVPAHLPADGRPVPARRLCDVGLAPALVPHQHDLLALRQCKMCVPAHASSDVWLSVASTIVSGTHGPLPFPAVALEMKIQGGNTKINYRDARHRGN